MKRVVVVGSVCLALAVAGCSKSSDSSDDAAQPAPTTSTPSTSTPTEAPTPDRTTEAPDPKAPAIDYDNDDGNGAMVKDPAGAESLSKAPADFKEFLATEVVRLQNEAGSDCANKPEIRVSKLQAAGWAAGSIFTPECGGYSVLWAKAGGNWAQVWGGQELVDCVTLMRYKFPVSVVGDQCLGQNGSSFAYTG